MLDNFFDVHLQFPEDPVDQQSTTPLFTEESFYEVGIVVFPVFELAGLRCNAFISKILRGVYNCVYYFSGLG